MYKQIFMSLLLAVPMAITPVASQASVDLNKDPIASCKDQIPFGAPVSGDKTKVFATVCHTGYLSHFDQRAHDPDWVSYTLTQFGLLGCNKRQNDFKRDPALSADVQASNADYASSGYDKGHLANAEDMRYDPDVEAESFYFTNMTPQLPNFNRGIWKHLEDRVRDWSAYLNGDDLNIISGPIYNVQKDKKIGQDSVDVPTGFWKIITDTKTHKSIAFKFDSQTVSSDDSIEKHISSISAIEQATGITFSMPSGVDKGAVSKMWDYTNGEFTREHRAACAKK